MLNNIEGNYPVGKINETNNKPTSEASPVTASSTAGSEEDLQSLNIDEHKEKIVAILEQIAAAETQIAKIQQEQDKLAEQCDSGKIKPDQYESRFSELSRQKTSLYNKIASNLNIVLLTIKMAEIEPQLQKAAQEAQSNYDYTNYDPSDSGIDSDISSDDSKTENDATDSASSLTGKEGSNVGNAVAKFGLSFIGKINNDKQGNQRFSNGREEAWCADFVSTIVKETYKKMGKPVPKGFGSAAVSNLREWGQDNDCYVNTAKMGSKQRANYIAQNIKPGDILIQKENGASHTGIVVKVYPDGSFDTVEGNTSDSVKRRSYPANHSKLSGFVRMA